MWKLNKKSNEDSKESQIREVISHPMADKFISGIDCDELPSAIGEFGRAISNPIPVNGPIGEIKYLTRMRLHGKPTMFHRLASATFGNIPDQAVDIYELCTFSGEHWDLLYFDMYHPRRSKKIPNNYTLSDFHPVFSKIGIGMGTTHRVKTFPYRMDIALNKEYSYLPEEARGALVKVYQQFFEVGKHYYRPIEHFSKILHLNNIGSFFEELIDFVAQAYPASYLSFLIRSSDFYETIAGLQAVIIKGVDAKECLASIVELDSRTNDEAVSELIADATIAIHPELKSIISKSIDALFEVPAESISKDPSKFDLSVHMLKVAGFAAIPYLLPLEFNADARIRRIAKDLIRDIRNKSILRT
jgi:hypothetical protein